MDFRDRLQRAADRGARARQARESAEAAEALSEEECRRRHTSYRLALCDLIEKRLQDLCDNLPGFHYQTVVDESGWGGAVTRDDVGLDGGRRKNLFSRLQIIVSQFNRYHVVDVTAKGAIRNKETFSRSHYEPISEFDQDHFANLIELWVLDYAEDYAAA